MTNENSGIHDSIAPTPRAPTRPAPQPCWKTATITPNAADIESTLSSTETAAMVTERKASSISRKASTSTKMIDRRDRRAAAGR